MTRRRSHQKGSVELHNGQWTLRYRELDHATGKWAIKREALGKFKNKKAALRAADPIMARVNERNNCRDVRRLYADITFKEFIEKRWAAYVLSAKHRPSTVSSHNSLIKIHILPYFGERRMSDITPSDVADFLASRKTRGGKGRVAGNTLMSLYILLNLMFEIARQFDYVEQSPVRPLVHKPEFERVEKPTLTASQIRELLPRLEPRDRLFHLLLSVTGIRMGEGLALRWLNFDAAKRELTITHTLYRGRLAPPKTVTSKGRLRLHPAVVSLLSSHRQRSGFHADEDFIFCRPDGSPLNPRTLIDRLHRAMDAIGIERVKHHYGCHIFRHTAATLLFDQLGDIGKVQAALRHADKATTGLYVHSDSPVVVESELLTEVILGVSDPNCALLVTQESEMVN